MCIQFSLIESSTCSVDSDYKADAQTNLGLCLSQIHKIHFYLKSLNCVLFYLETPQRSTKDQQDTYFYFISIKKIFQTYINTSLITAHVYCVFR